MSKQALANEAALLDMARLKMVVELAALRTCNTMEVDAPNCLFSAVVSNFFYGSGSGSNLVTGLLAELESYKTLAVWTVEEWMAGRPTQHMHHWQAVGQAFGPAGGGHKAAGARHPAEVRADGLQKLADKLAHAQQANDRPHPNSFIANFPIPSLRSIQWIDVQDKMFLTNLQQSQSFVSSFKFPEGEGAGGSGGAQFGQDNKDDLYA
ncbi:hypothetical protein PCANC_21042 [Puccinia coronata f. sp. avenae]|uniref:Uncharacterized protein n=1 Tax=Puccinia coronata f. sp. avenae TaxID=200324 RepID=A0A2N5TWC3_9BASI|nr:hypothetical protein PCANC_21042 [Puccinia coronata f. sp. avenae]